MRVPAEAFAHLAGPLTYPVRVRVASRHTSGDGVLERLREHLDEAPDVLARVVHVRRNANGLPAQMSATYPAEARREVLARLWIALS